jgi:hypothetical protein
MGLDVQWDKFIKIIGIEPMLSQLQNDKSNKLQVLFKRFTVDQ